MKYLISLSTVNHNNSVNNSIYEVNTNNESELFNILFEKISKAYSTPNMIKRFKEILESLKEQEILSYDLYKETSKDSRNDSYAKFETIMAKTKNSLAIELHRSIDEISNNPFLNKNPFLTHSILLQVLITN